MEIKIDKALNLFKAFRQIISDADDFMWILGNDPDTISQLLAYENAMKNGDDTLNTSAEYHSAIDKFKKKLPLGNHNYFGELIMLRGHNNEDDDDPLREFKLELKNNLTLNKPYSEIHNAYITVIENFPDSYAIYWSKKIEIDRIAQFRYWFGYLNDKEKIELPQVCLRAITKFRNALNVYDQEIKSNLAELKEKADLALKFSSKEIDSSNKVNQSHFIRCLNQIITKHYSGYDKTDVARLAHFMLFNERVESKDIIQGMYNAITTKIDSQKNSQPRERAIEEYLAKLNK